jgi:hypothetical protein
LTKLITQTTQPQQLLELVVAHQAALDYIHLSAAFSRLAKMKLVARQRPAAMELLGQLDQLLLPKLDQCGVRQLSNTAWSCSKLSYTNTQLFAGCMVCFLQQAEHQQQPQGFSNVLWAAANSRYPLHQRQLQQLIALLTRSNILQHTKPQEVSNTLWAVAKMGQQLEQQQLAQLLDGLLCQLDQAKPQHVSNTLWAVATMGQQLEQQQLAQLLDGLLCQLDQAKPQDVSNTLWAVATMGQQLEQQQLAQLLDGLLCQLDQAKPQEVSNTLWACAKFRYLPLQLLKALHSERRWAGLIQSASP